MTDEDIRDRLAALVAWYESRRKNVDKEIAAAVAAERERCCTVVAGFAYRGDFGTRPPDPFINEMLRAIREGK